MLAILLALLAGTVYVVGNRAAQNARTNQETVNGPVFGVDSNYLSVGGLKDTGYAGYDGKPAGYVKAVRDVPNTLSFGANQMGARRDGGSSNKSLLQQTLDAINATTVARITGTPSTSSAQPTQGLSAPAAPSRLGNPAQDVSISGTTYQHTGQGYYVAPSGSNVVMTPYWIPGVSDQPGVIYTGPPVSPPPPPTVA
jgi:hypothetical protein